MSALIDLYNHVVLRVNDINEKIQKAEQEIEQLSSAFSGNTSARIDKLKEQLVKIDDYVLKIKGFQELAKKNLDSQNVLTIEAPPGYRVNLNRLRNWAMMIDPTSPNDPYAQRVYIVAKCDEHFLESKRKEFNERIEELSAEKSRGSNAEIEGLKSKVSGLKNELRQYAESQEIAEFAKAVVEENEKYWHKTSPEEYRNCSQAAETLAPGAYAAPFHFYEEQRKLLKTLMGDFYDADGGRVLIPAGISNAHEYVMTVTCSPSRRKKLDKALQNLVISTVNDNPAGTRKVYVLDGVRFNSSSMGTLRQLEGSFAMEQIPRNPDQLTSALEQLVSSFADMDDLLELYDSVSEYNANAEDGKKLPFSTVILFGWPHSYEGHDRELIQRIMTNYERYGISFITVAYSNTENQDSSGKNAMPEYAMQNAVHISMLKNETTITFADGKPQRFTWYSFNDSLSAEFAESLLENNIVREEKGNEYIKRYSLVDRPAYVREYKKIELPFGIDGKDSAHSLSFENENFATYLVGASRSGKSTLLHTLIAGLIRNYHPDNVELWLADFKQLEFKRYIKHLPPHVKYVLLDESAELVYDLIDKLTDEMMERQKLFSRLGKQRIDQVDTTELEKPLPVIFVILDEFSIMSQSIAESPVYKLRLQNILAKGAALGIKFLFSSQTFTTGVAGLTSTARAQIQQRIAMKGSKEEISETLELSSNLKTDQVRNWMDALPPHYALVKFRISADTLPQVKRFLVMYFRDYKPRDRMIDDIKSSMQAVQSYTPSDINSYVYKHPVLVDGNTFDAFDENELTSYINDIKSGESASDLSGDEMFISFGTPRLMVKMKPAVISNETRENILLIARSAEQSCAASIILSVLKSYKVQHGEVQMWVYGKNKLYRSYKQIFAENGISVKEGIDDICDAIRELKQSITDKKAADRMIALIGIDRICLDFDYVDNDNPASSEEPQASISEVRKDFAKNGAVVSSDDEEAKRQYALKWIRYRKPYVKKAEAEGKTKEEIKSMLQELEMKFRIEEGYTAAENSGAEHSDTENKKSEPRESSDEAKKQTGGAYNAKDDFAYVIKQGSRLGYHFLLDLNSLADLKQCGLKSEFFRYKMAFQVSVEDSRALFNNKIAGTLPEHICQFDDSLERFSFRPYLHKGIGWEGWYVDDSSNVISPYEDSEE